MTTYAIFCVVVILLLGMAGVIGNILIVGAILLEKQLKNLGNVFIINLAIVDFLVTAIAFPAIVANVISGNIFPKFGCIIIGSVSAGGTMLSALNIAAIALERFIKVCHSAIYTRCFSKLTIPLHVILMWTVTILSLSQAYFLAGNSFVYDDRVKLCIIELNDLPAWYVLILSSMVGSAIFLCCVCYFKILQRVRQSKIRVGVSNATRNKMYSMRELSLFRTMFTVFSLFLTLSTPGAIIIILVSANFSLPDEMLQWSIYLMLCNSVVNGFVYGITNSQFRKGYLKFVDVIFCGKSFPMEHKISVCDDASVC